MADVAATQNGVDVVNQAMAAGVPVPAEVPQITGPASVTSPPVQKSTTANGQTLTTTTTTTVTNTYNNNQVTYNVTNNSVTTNQAGEVVTTTSEQVAPEPETPEEAETQVVDKPLSAVPKLYERKYPDGLVGVWNTRKADLMATPLFSLSAIFAPTNISGGSCPAWGMSFNIGPNMNYGSGTFDVPCWVWDSIKAIMIISALLLSRRLIFGG